MEAFDEAKPLALDHEQCKVIRMSTDIRFKLLALVPTVRALNVVVSGEPGHEPTPFGLGLVGVVATLNPPVAATGQ